MGYHLKEIAKGQFGEFSKIQEEFEEADDAMDQRNPVMVLIELSDMLGAIEAYVEGHYSLTLDDLIIMKNATKRAFQDGTRNNRVDLKDENCNLLKDGDYNVPIVFMRGV